MKIVAGREGITWVSGPKYRHESPRIKAQAKPVSTSPTVRRLVNRNVKISRNDHKQAKAACRVTAVINPAGVTNENYAYNRQARLTRQLYKPLYPDSR